MHLTGTNSSSSVSNNAFIFELNSDYQFELIEDKYYQSPIISIDLNEDAGSFYIGVEFQDGRGNLLEHNASSLDQTREF